MNKMNEIDKLASSPLHHISQIGGIAIADIPPMNLETFKQITADFYFSPAMTPEMAEAGISQETILVTAEEARKLVSAKIRRYPSIDRQYFMTWPFTKKGYMARGTGILLELSDDAPIVLTLRTWGTRSIILVKEL